MTNITCIGVIGAGQMGAGIAQVCAAAGIDTLLWDGNPDALQRGYNGIGTQLQRLAEKGKISEEDCKRTLRHVCCASSMADLGRCEFAVEAIIENFEAKGQLLAKLDALLPKHAVLATNTSSISITKLAAATQRADRVLGVHFMNPVPVMKLVELIRGLQTSDATYQLALDLMRRLGKETVLGCDSPGFIVNRILVPMVNEAIYLLQEGVKAEDIDTAMKLGTNQPMGPLTLADFVGLDTLLYILQVLHRELGEDKYRPCPLLVKYVEAGWFGRKSGRGFYRYDQNQAARSA